MLPPSSGRKSKNQPEALHPRYMSRIVREASEIEHEHEQGGWPGNPVSLKECMMSCVKNSPGCWFSNGLLGPSGCGLSYGH
jgi:hypothetical protein